MYQQWKIIILFIEIKKLRIIKFIMAIQFKLNGKLRDKKIKYSSFICSWFTQIRNNENK